jgi:hypothetical protein
VKDEPCINCEENAAPGWLLCVKCAATMPDDLVEKLITKYEQSEQWLTNAEAFLANCRRDSQMFRDGFRSHHRALRVYERLQQFIVTAIAMRAGWPEVELAAHLTVLRGEAGWRKFLEYTSLDEVDLKGGRKPPPPLLKRAIEVLRQRSPAAEGEPDARAL